MTDGGDADEPVRWEVSEWKTVSEAGLGGWVRGWLEVRSWGDSEAEKRESGKTEKREAVRGKGIDDLSELFSLAVARLLGGFRG